MVNTEKGITMKILQWIKSLFGSVSYKDTLERFVASKNPQTVAEVEYWVRHYDHHSREWVI